MGNVFDTEGKKIGEKLFALRKEKGMTQEALADLLQVSRQSVSKWESDIAFPETEKIIALTKIFDISLNYLLTGKEYAQAEMKGNNKIRKLLSVNMIIRIVLGILPLLITVMFLVFFPPRIPAHYDSSGNITRWGSKYENLIFPTINLILAVFLYILERFIKKQLKEKEMIAVQFVFNATVLALFVLIIYFLIKSYNIAIDNGQNFSINYFQVAFLALGLFFLIVGAIMPFTSKNAAFGLRTNLSMQSDELWKMSQAVAGITLVFLGLILIVLNTFYSNRFFNAVISLPLSIMFVIIAIVLPYIVARKKQGNEKQ